jgi:hypothetical protein
MIQTKPVARSKGSSHSLLPNRRAKKCILLFSLLMGLSTVGYSQLVVTDFYNGVINTVSQVIQSASKIINSEAFKQATKVVEKLKQVEGGVQQFRRIQETASYIQSSIVLYKKALQVISEDRHFTPNELAGFYKSLEKLTQQDAKLIDDLGSGIKANLVEMSSAERMNFIMKIHSDASSSTARLRAFVSGIEYLSLRRARTTNDRLKTMQLYAVARGGDYSHHATGIDFGKYTEQEVDFDGLDKRGKEAAEGATQTQMDWLTDASNPEAKEAAIRSLIYDPMPQKPEFDFKNPVESANQIRYYNDRLENWQATHARDLQVLGNKSLTVMNKPVGLSDAEWMQVLANKIRKGEI